MQKIMFSLLAISLLTVGNLPVFAASVSKGETVALAIAPLLAERDDTYIQKFYEMLDSIIQKFSNDEKKSALLDDLKEVLVSKVPIPNINISNTVSNTTIINNTYNTYTNNDNSNNSINTNNATNTNNTYTDNSKTINNISVDNSTHQNQDNSVNHTDNSINVGDTNKGNTSNNENSNTPTTYPTTPNTPVSDATLTLSKNVQTQNLMIQEEQNITLATIPIQVQNGDVRLQTLELDGNFPSLDPFRVELKINGNDI
ncbi:MAG: hypothetical protein LBG59_04610 [Candidatus Peribacteria bacterium]|jgi:hypothetical protein|nr:hypothetical protein [Candidatus Peribacteria bacterium]